MSAEVSRDILDIWDEKAFNPSVRHQTKSNISLGKVIAEKVEKEVFSKFPELVAGNIKVDVIDNIQYDMAEIYVSWRVWIPTGFSENAVTLENVKAIIKIPIITEILENQPENLSLQFKQALDVIEDQMKKATIEFYKLGIDPNIVRPYLKKYSHGKIIKVPILNKSATINAGVVP